MTPGPTRLGLSRLETHTYNFHKFAERISFAEHWKLFAESSEFHLTLSTAHGAQFSNSKYAKERDILSEKRESGMTQKKREFRPKAVMLTPMEY